MTFLKLLSQQELFCFCESLTYWQDEYSAPPGLLFLSFKIPGLKPATINLITIYILVLTSKI